MSTDNLKQKSMLFYIERFHSHGQELHTFIGVQESVYVKKSSAPTGMIWYTNMTTITLFGNQYGRQYVMTYF